MSDDLVERLRASAKDAAAMDRMTVGAYARAPRQYIQWEAAEALTTAQAQAAAQEQRIAELSAHVQTLVQLAIDGGLTHDLVAQLYPDSKKPNGQPAHQFAKRAQRAVNEARVALGEQQ